MKRPFRMSDRMKAEQAHVEKRLPDVICKRCGATLATYAEKCLADLTENCQGYRSIEKAKREFWGGQYGVQP